ncbi:MAG: AAA family ATPase [Synergistes sp.]|nr:AAA family ATPase [Synergistes sp.]
MLYRRSYETLLKWKESKTNPRKAICLAGARQTGKTTLIREFAKKNYEYFVEINFVTDNNAAKIFSGSLDADTITANLTAYVRKPMPMGKTLLFLDEIQECPEARTAIKFLVEDGRYDCAESGSLLGIRHKNVKSYPVGYEEIRHIHPMDFSEFMLANGVQDSTIDYLRECFEKRVPVSDSVHSAICRLYYVWLVVGGMPEAVQRYVDRHDIAEVIAYQKDILEQYRLDISKYAEGSGKPKIRAIFDRLPSQLGEKNRRFFVTSVDKNARLQNYEESFKWLEDAGVALPCRNLLQPVLPLSLNEKRSLFKLYMNDTGLLCASYLNNVQFALLNGELGINLGSILENAIAQQLKANGFTLNYFDSKQHGETDFVLQNGSEIMPIEVKSGNDYKKHKALDNLLAVEAWNLKQAYVLCKDNLHTEGKICYLPWYMSVFIRPPQFSEKFIYSVDLSALQ